MSRARVTGAPLFLNWYHEHGRSTDIAEALGIEDVFVNEAPGRPLPLRYLRNTLVTVRLLLRRRPKAVILMLPPLPLLVIVSAWARLTQGLVVGDLHSAVYNDRSWTWAHRPTLRLLRRDMAVVTNRTMQAWAEAGQVRTLLLHDRLAELPAGEAPTDLPTGPTALFPAGYYPDEPIAALLEAAGSLPEVTFLLTGKAPDDVRRSAPANVRFTGFVSTEAYQGLVHAVDVVLALTTRDHTMQRAGYEALCAQRPLVCSGTETLREFFADAAVYCEPTSSSIAAAVSTAIAEADVRAARLAEVLAVRSAEQETALAELAKELSLA